MTSEENPNFPIRPCSDLAPPPPLRPPINSQVTPTQPPPPPPSATSGVAPPPPTTVDHSHARRQLVAEYRESMYDAIIVLYYSLLLLCLFWYIFLVGPVRYITRKTVFHMLMADIVISLLSTLYIIGSACFLYLLDIGREDIAREWSRKVIVEFIFRTHKANAIFDRYPPPFHISDSNLRSELADEYLYMCQDSFPMLVVSLFLFFLPAYPLLSGRRSGQVVVALFIMAVVVTAFCLYRLIVSERFYHLVCVGREDIVRKWSQRMFFFSTTRTKSIFQRISIQQQEAANYNKV